MTEVLRSPSQLPLSPRRSSLSCSPNDTRSSDLLSPYNGGIVEDDDTHSSGSSSGSSSSSTGAIERKRERRRRGEGERRGAEEEEEEEAQQISVLELLLTVLRKSLLGCNTEGGGDEDLRSMEIGWPTDVRHVAHVTFDRFHGFLGLPVEFEPEVPRRVPSASTTVFGVSTESMQCSYDSRGNSVPTILLLMQRRLYEQGGLGAEGIFRINAENSQEEYVRDQLNNGIVPEGIDIHCIAGLIKAWFRELPIGILDSLSSEQVMQCQTEEDCTRLARLLPAAEAALLDWVVNLMTDVVKEEQHNKMNARNIATVFAPNMTQMADPLTALMYAVQVMNFLRMLILKTLKERQENALMDSSVPSIDPSDENGHQCSQLLEARSEEAKHQMIAQEEPVLENRRQIPQEKSTTDESANSPRSYSDNNDPEMNLGYSTSKLVSENSAQPDGSTSDQELVDNCYNSIYPHSHRSKLNWTNSQNHRKGRKPKGQSAVGASRPAEKSRGVSIVTRINSKAERVEAWR